MTAIGKAAHTTKWIRVKDLDVVWAQAQRHLDEKRAAKIAEEFDPDMFGVLSVTKVGDNGMYHVIDGQHRRRAVQILWGETEMVPCNVFDASSPARAAEIFDAMNTSRKSPQAIEIFKVRVTAGTEPEASVNKIITGLGYHVANASKMDGALRAVTACVSVYKRFGAAGLRDALFVIQGTWGKAQESVDANMIRGYAEFLATYGERIDRQRLVDRVAKQYTPGRLMGAAKSAREMFRGSVSENIGKVLVSTYNHGLRSGRIDE